MQMGGVAGICKMYDNKVQIFVLRLIGGKRQLENRRMHDFTPQGTSLLFPQIEISLITSCITCSVSPTPQIASKSTRGPYFAIPGPASPSESSYRYFFPPRWSRELSLLWFWFRLYQVGLIIRKGDVT